MSPPQQYFPIRELSTYYSKWTICARITSKGQLREFASRQTTEPGKVFNVDLLDAEKGEISASFFGHAADVFYSKLEPGKCYTFSRGNVKVANAKFNSCKHRYELIFDKQAVIEEVAENSKIAAINYCFLNLKAVQSKDLPCTVDLCCVVASYRATFGFTSRDGKELVKREITLADDTATSMGVTLWGDRAKQEDSVFDNQPVVCLKGVLVKEWNGGRSGSLLGGGSMDVNADLPEVHKLRQWWTNGGSVQSLAALSQTFVGGDKSRIAGARSMTLTDMRRACEMVAAEPEVYTTVCRLALVQMKKMGGPQPLYYMACQELKQGSSSHSCNKKLDESGFCAACGRMGRAAPRWNLRCRFNDATDAVWLTTFHEPVQTLLGMTSEEARALESGEGGRDALERAISNQYFSRPLQVTTKARLEMFNGQPKTNTMCIDARPVSLREHGRALMKEIRQMLV